MGLDHTHSPESPTGGAAASAILTYENRSTESGFDEISLNDFKVVQVIPAELEAPPSPPSDQSSQSNYEIQTAWAVFRQMAPSFIIAGFGSVFAGIVHNAVTQVSFEGRGRDLQWREMQH